MAAKNGKKFCPYSTSMLASVNSHKSPKWQRSTPFRGEAQGRKELSSCCYKCKGAHSPKDCSFKSAECCNCHKNKKGTHCCSLQDPETRDGKRQQGGQVHDVEEDAKQTTQEISVYSIYSLESEHHYETNVMKCE